MAQEGRENPKARPMFGIFDYPLLGEGKQ